MNEPIYERMQQLIRQIRQADTAYYKHDAPIMSDLEYDRLMDDLVALEEHSSVILSNSPTQHVAGETLETLAEVRHTKPMLSAAKTKSVDDLIRFAAGQDVLLSWKMDGLTLVLRYENGHLKQAITRGRDGIIGEDVTHTVKTFLNVPLTIPISEAFEVRGEGVISWKNFDTINADLDDAYSHPRNLAAGSVRKLDASEAQKRMLEFWAFDLVSDSLESGSKHAQQKLLAYCGFSVVPYLYLPFSCSARDIERAIFSMQPTRFAYPVDGLIMEYDDLAYGRSLGATGHHENRLIALKWADELYETTFRSIELATTRTGMVSLTARFDPVSMDGATVSRAYLHNLDNFRALQLGSGDTIRVYRANMIIPQIACNLTKSGTYRLPMSCPCCGAVLEVGETTGRTHQLFCRNRNCAARLVQKFVHFCDKSRMNIEGLSETTLEKLIGHGWIHTFADLYELEQHRDAILQTDGFGEKSFERLQAAIEKSRTCTLAKFIAGLGIPTVGRHAGRALERCFAGSWEAFEAAIQKGFDFTQLPDFGAVMQENIYTWYADAEEAKLWRPLLEKIQFIKETTPMSITKESPLYGKIVVATGKLKHYTRDGIQNKLLEIGAIPASSVTKKTNYLIVGEKAGSKLTKAQQLGVPTLTEEEFEALLAG